MFKCFITILLPILCCGHPEPELANSTSSLVGTVAGTVELQCIFHHVNADEYLFSWLKETEDPNNLYKLLSRGSRTIPDDRYNVTLEIDKPPVEPNDRIYAFRIRDLQESDSGTYLCDVHLSPVTRLEGKMTLMVEPPIENGKQSLAAGQQVETNSTGDAISTVTPAPNGEVNP